MNLKVSIKQAKINILDTIISEIMKTLLKLATEFFWATAADFSAVKSG